MEMMEDPQMTTTATTAIVEGDVVEIIADYGLGALGVIRLLFTFVYCALLSILPLIAGWVVAYKLWIHKWSWVREILWRDPTHNRLDSRARGTYLARRQPSLASVAAVPAASATTAPVATSGTSSSSTSAASAATVHAHSD